MYDKHIAIVLSISRNSCIPSTLTLPETIQISDDVLFVFNIIRCFVTFHMKTKYQKFSCNSGRNIHILNDALDKN